jgi:AcrR family transcriptional regulator
MSAHTTPLPQRCRAVPLPADQRRAAIVAATLPLLHEFGRAVTTKQIAEAAGIAEGTIFRVFPDKDSLIDAAMQAAFDPSPAIAELDAIPRELDLAERLRLAADVLLRRLASIWQLMSSVGLTKPPSFDPAAKRSEPRPELLALAELIAHDATDLRVDPVAAAQLLWGLTVAANHPTLVFDTPLTPAEIVTVLLDGIRTTTAHDPRS